MRERLVLCLFPLRGSNPVLYTSKAADIVVDKQTGREYLKDEPILFYKKDGPFPTTIEESEPDRWEFVLLKQGEGLNTKDYLREMFVSSLFRK